MYDGKVVRAHGGYAGLVMTTSYRRPEALAAGEAFVDVSSWRTIAIAGDDAFGWLNDLISADIAGLASGRARRSLLLAPTGGVLASFTVSMPQGELLLVQDPAEPRPIDRLLSTYVLSSDVQIQDRTGDFTMFAFPGRNETPEAAETTASTPSALGTGTDLVAPAEDHDRLWDALTQAFVPANGSDVESWRVAMGLSKVGVDTADGDLPQECGLEDAVSFDKGCFLGQEAVAKVRNLGHPRRLLLAVESDDELAPGTDVLSEGRDVGAITSVGRFEDVFVALARIRWGGDDRLRTGDGTELRSRGVPGLSGLAATP